MYTTIQKSYYRFLENFIKEHLDILINVRVFIFGAGIRGCNLLSILRFFKISNIIFVDNNPQKQGLQIDGCSVISFLEADKYCGKHVFLCPVENGGQILEQLARTGRSENADYFNLDFEFTDYLDVIDEIKSSTPNYSLAFGCCILSSNILGNRLSPSMGEVLKQQLFPKHCKLCTMPGFSPPMYYYTIKTATHLNQASPRFLFLTMEISSCSPYAPLMLGRQNLLQHKLFLEQLARLVPQDNEICEYSRLINERLKLSLTGKNPIKSDVSQDSRRRVYKLKYNYNIREDDESIVYTKKILISMNEKRTPVILYFPPIDYMFAETICGEDFSVKYASIIKKIRSFLEGTQYRCIDASFVEKSDCFVQQINSPDIDPILNNKGQKQLLRFLMDHEEMKLFLTEDIQ